jgi:hypothetical protein
LTLILGQAFSDPQAYRPIHCCANANELTKRAVAQGVPLEKINVLYLLYERYVPGDVPVPRKADLVPARPRQGYLPYTWRTHVVLEIDGKILDLDFKPSAVPIDEYFKEMFPRSRVNPDGDLTQHIRMRVIPASQHQQEFERRGGEELEVLKRFGDREDSLPEYPVQKVSDFVTATFRARR